MDMTTLFAASTAGRSFSSQEKNQKRSQGATPLENPLNGGGYFLSDDPLVCSSLIPSLVRRSSASTHLFYRRRDAAAPLLGSGAPAPLPGRPLAAGQ